MVRDWQGDTGRAAHYAHTGTPAAMRWLGHGYAEEPAAGVLAAGFTRFDAREIFAITAGGNTMSWGSRIRLGVSLREEPDYPGDRYERELRGTIVYSIAGNEWDLQ